MQVHESCNNEINKTPNRGPKPHQKAPHYHPSVHPSKCQKNTHPQRKSFNNHPPSAFHSHNDCIPSSQWLLCSWAAVCTLHIGHIPGSWRIHIVIVLAHWSHIPISYKNLLVIGKEKNTTVSDDRKKSLLSHIPFWEVLFKLLEACFPSQKASWIWVPRLTIIIRFLHNIVYHILGWMWEDNIQWKLAVATTHRCLGTSCMVSFLAMINHAKNYWVA